mgnify:FL=1
MKAVGLVIVAACSSRDPAPAPMTEHLEVTKVQCYTKLTEPDGPDIDLFGPGACSAALGKYLLTHPQERILAVVPVQGPAAKVRLANAGTQHLLVVHAAKPDARTLVITEWVCKDDCVSALAGVAYGGQEIWIPISSSERTERILILQRRQ